ncbi:RluA family pseudouridine synthase [Companilactobacillus alimentarius]|uniref:RluA family pseudouridine synthase n=1 Tax=Companilactobacillus alimentarius TaxID=1602 RepID=UPI0006F17EE3|nr:RluA family pseudouridine synthase [Companilactobacillus alimentarius]KRK78384.1 pseudouridine synthase [Companilactobacillus alimentarius DSM 20249]MDT6953406.1 RluA family pseudouridine synthase [Companilactobacillus alimentarius]GEO44658.1 pseudouridine synthase [Companilactobacillus alimentarius]
MKKNNRFLKFVINDNDKRTVRRFLVQHKFSSSQLHNLKNKGGQIFVNHRQRHFNFGLKTGDEVLVVLSNEKPSDLIEPMRGPVDVIFEDDYLLVINKPPGIASLPAKARDGKTMANLVKAYLIAKNENSSIHLVTRLDRDTSGLMVFAKTSYAHSLLDQILHTEDFQKFYLAMIDGQINPKQGLIDLPIGIDPQAFYRRVIDYKNGKESKTLYKTVAHYPKASLLELKLLTGRTHQIRVHLSAIGYPIIGDDMYSGKKDQRISRQALHCYNLRIVHPVTKELLNLKAPLPKDMVILKGVLRGERNG